MKLPYQVVEYLGRSTAMVFKVLSENKLWALKVYYRKYINSDIGDIGILRKQAEQEYFNLQLLQGIPGIPLPKNLFKDVSGSYAEIGLDHCGKPLSEILPSIDFNPHFASPFTMQLYEPPLRRVYPFHDNLEEPLPATFFLNLEFIVDQVHSKGICLPGDVSIFEKYGSPILLDWYGAKRFSSRSEQNKRIQQDWSLLLCIKRLFQ